MDFTVEESLRKGEDEVGDRSGRKVRRPSREVCNGGP